MIEIGLDQYTDIFSDWDPAPFKRREIDPDLKLYLEGSSDEVPLRYPIELCFTLPANIRDQPIEQETRKGLKNSFNFNLYLLKKQIKKSNAQMARFVVIGFVCLWIAANSAERVEKIGFLTTLIEGLSITGFSVGSRFAVCIHQSRTVSALPNLQATVQCARIFSRV